MIVKGKGMWLAAEFGVGGFFTIIGDGTVSQSCFALAITGSTTVIGVLRCILPGITTWDQEEPAA